MYNLALLTADWNYELVSASLRGVFNYLNTHPDVRVFVFDCFGLDQNTEKNRLEYAIYNLMDLSLFDGLIVQTHQIVQKDALARVGQIVMEAGIPYVSIGGRLGDAVQIQTDDFEAQRVMAEHMIRVHGARTFLYLKGMEENGIDEASLRREGFAAACRENGIPDRNISYYDGNWRIEGGREAARRLLAAGGPLPDAILSANDEMALGAMDVLRNAGVRVPEDVIIGGFDKIRSATISSPGLSTIDRDFPQILCVTLEELMRQVHLARGEASPDRANTSDGQELQDAFRQDSPEASPQDSPGASLQEFPNTTPSGEFAPVWEHTVHSPGCGPGHICSPFTTAYSESCGCKENELERFHQVKREFFHQTRFLRDFYLTQDRLSTGLIEADSLARVMEVIEQHSGIFGCDNLYLCLNDSYVDRFEQPEEQAAADGYFSEQSVLMACKRTAREHDANHEYLRFPRSCLLQLLTQEQMVTFYPLHNNGIMMGYLILCGTVTAAEMNLHESLINLIVFALENVRKRRQMECLNEKLKELYVTDPLTGLYNRFGLYQVALPMGELARQEGEDVHVIFIDIDDMKSINDRFGHEYGDIALQAAAKLLRETADEGEVMVRYGGDEFVMIGTEQGGDIEQRIQSALADWNEGSSFPFDLKLSVGKYVSPAYEKKPLSNCLQEADSRMYEHKVRAKRERNADGRGH